MFASNMSGHIIRLSGYVTTIRTPVRFLSGMNSLVSRKDTRTSKGFLAKSTSRFTEPDFVVVHKLLLKWSILCIIVDHSAKICRKTRQKVLLRL